MNTRLLLAASLVLATPLAFAQDTTQPAPAPSSQAAPAPPSSHRHEGGDHDWGSKQGWDHGDHGRGTERGGGHERGWDRGERGDRGEGMMSFGMWWKNPEVATRIGLSADQKKQIEDLFLQSRLQLIHLHASLQEEQLMLEPLLSAAPFDEAKALEQINRIADTRADLEKTNAKMLLNIRGVLTADQWAKLRTHDHGPHRPEGDLGNRRPQGAPATN